MLATEGAPLRTVVLATGSKCVGRGALQAAAAAGVAGDVLRDSHAEVLARRGLVRLLLAELAHRQAGGATPDGLLEPIPGIGAAVEAGAAGAGPRFQLREGAALHLYVSEPPCGDASLFDLADGSGLAFTGAKLVASGEGLRVPGTQTVGALRLKSGRSNLPSDPPPPPV